MCNDACELRFAIGSLDRPKVDSDRPTRQCKCIDIFFVHHFEIEIVGIGRQLMRQLLSQSAYVILNGTASGKLRQLRVNFRGKLAPKLHFLLWRELVKSVWLWEC